MTRKLWVLEVSSGSRALLDLSVAVSLRWSDQPRLVRLMLPQNPFPFLLFCAACLHRYGWLSSSRTEQRTLVSSIVLVLLKPDPAELLQCLCLFQSWLQPELVGACLYLWLGNAAPGACVHSGADSCAVSRGSSLEVLCTTGSGIWDPEEMPDVLYQGH